MREGSPEPLTSAFARIEDSFATAFSRGSASEHFITIAGCSLRLRFAEQQLADLLFPALAHLASGSVSAPRWTVGVWDTESSGVPLPEPPIGAYRHVGGRLIAAGGGIASALELAFHGFAIADRTRRSAFFHLPAPSALPLAETAMPLRAIFNWALGSEGLQLAHAGAVATAGGGLLVTGPGGAGKSNTCLAALTAGWSYLGDDYVVLGSGEGPTVHSLYASAKLYPSDLPLFPSLASSLAFEPGEGDKAILLLHPRFRAQLAVAAPLRAVLLPRVGGRGLTRLVPTSRAESLKAMAPTTVLTLPGAGARELRGLAQTAARLPSYVLELGGDRSATAEILADLIAKLERKDEACPSR